MRKGVDLNRNYDWSFGEGSDVLDQDPCSDTYPGPYPFSEPETQAMKAFIEANANDIKLAFNLHSYGNMLVHPFSNTNREDLRVLYPEQYKIYNEVWEDGNFPMGNVKGTATQIVGYAAPGEASDWMFGTHGIIAFSPELGLNDTSTRGFYIDNRTLAYEILKQNDIWVQNSFLKLGVMFGVEHLLTHYDSHNLTLHMNLINKGFANYDKANDTTRIVIVSQVITNMQVGGNATLLSR